MPYGAHETMETHEILMEKINMITHFNLYARETRNQQLRDMIMRHQQEEIRAYNELVSYTRDYNQFSPIPPNTDIRGMRPQQIQYGSENAPQFAPQTDGNFDDREIAVAMLLCHKNAARNATWASLECADPNLRRLLLNSSANCVNQAYEVFLFMNEQGMYPVPTLNTQAAQSVLHRYQPAGESLQAKYGAPTDQNRSFGAGQSGGNAGYGGGQYMQNAGGGYGQSAQSAQTGGFAGQSFQSGGSFGQNVGYGSQTAFGGALANYGGQTGAAGADGSQTGGSSMGGAPANYGGQTGLAGADGSQTGRSSMGGAPANYGGQTGLAGADGSQTGGSAVGGAYNGSSLSSNLRGSMGMGGQNGSLSTGSRGSVLYGDGLSGGSAFSQNASATTYGNQNLHGTLT